MSHSHCKLTRNVFMVSFFSSPGKRYFRANALILLHVISSSFSVWLCGRAIPSALHPSSASPFQDRSSSSNVWLYWEIYQIGNQITSWYIYFEIVCICLMHKTSTDQTNRPALCWCIVKSIKIIWKVKLEILYLASLRCTLNSLCYIL